VTARWNESESQTGVSIRIKGVYFYIIVWLCLFLAKLCDFYFNILIIITTMSTRLDKKQNRYIIIVMFSVHFYFLHPEN